MFDAALEARSSAHKPPINYDEWVSRNLGKGIGNVFARPYSFKVWAIPADQVKITFAIPWILIVTCSRMQSEWLGERVAAPDAKKSMTNVLRGTVSGNWGPNATFRYPPKGGRGGLWSAVARTLPEARMNYRKHVDKVDEDNKIITFADGTTSNTGDC